MFSVNSITEKVNQSCDMISEAMLPWLPDPLVVQHLKIAVFI